jgi:hypothetical protein
MRYHGLSIIDTLGLALGGYDIWRNPAVFHQQLQYFFGQDAEKNITYTVEELAPDVPLLIYNVSGTTVFGFRGFATAAEFALQVEMFADRYVTPRLLDLMPLYNVINEHYLKSNGLNAHLLGSFWFSPRSAFDDLLQRALDIYNDYEFAKDAKVVFVGIDTGGVLAKVLALITGHHGIGFISLPVTTELFDGRYDYDERNAKLTTNVFNLDTLIGNEDQLVGENFAIPGDADVIGMDMTYPSFCNLAETCGYHRQFAQYCTQAMMDNEKLGKIRAYLGLSEDGSDGTTVR